MNERLKRMREELDPGWDEVREMRVLSKLLVELNNESQEVADRVSPPVPRRWIAPSLFALAAVAASVALVLGLSELQRERRSMALNQGSKNAASMSPSELRFSKGTVAWLESGAKVQTLEQSSEVIELGQTRGEVRYEVDPARGYLFRVRVDQLVIEVVGTSFQVVVQPDSVYVSVTHGEVNVIDDDRIVRLLPGENARLGRTKSSKRAEVPSSTEAFESDTSDAPQPERESAKSLLSRSDAARKRSSWAEAEQLLLRVVTEHPKDPQVATAWFLLGKVRKETGRHQQAASDFARVQRLAPGSSLSEDALYEEAIARKSAGDGAGASARARMYFERYPSGPHAARLGKLFPE